MRCNFLQLQNVLQSSSHYNCIILEKRQSLGQWDRLEYPETEPQIYEHLMLGKSAKNVKWSKEIPFNSGDQITNHLYAKNKK